MGILDKSTLDEPPPEFGPWGEGLAYPEWVQRALPAMHDAFNGMNKYVGVPALKMGLGRYISNPLTGYLMILRTRGRKSGEMLSLIHISEPTRLGMISYAVF